jgi:REP element-mobilizing transposase RayT
VVIYCLIQVGPLNSKPRRELETVWGPVPVPRRATRSRAKATRREPGQLSLGEVVTWGGRRVGAGRKRALRPKVPHEARPAHRRYQPAHVTLRRAKGGPSLRVDRILCVLQEAMRSNDDRFRITHYSVQADHVHLIVEADSEAHADGGLSRGIRGFVIRVALRVNRLLRRKRGRVWGDRYHHRELTTPSEVRSALVYVLANHIKHGEYDVGLVDPFSSGPWFEGWMQVLERPPDPSPVAGARTWLLDWGWHRGRDYIYVGEVPRASR